MIHTTVGKDNTNSQHHREREEDVTPRVFTTWHDGSKIFVTRIVDHWTQKTKIYLRCLGVERLLVLWSLSHLDVDVAVGFHVTVSLPRVAAKSRIMLF